MKQTIEQNTNLEQPKKVNKLSQQEKKLLEKALKEDYKITSLVEAKKLLELANKTERKNEILLDRKVLSYLIEIKDSENLTAEERKFISEMIEKNLDLEERKNKEIKKLVKEIKPLLAKNYVEVTNNLPMIDNKPILVDRKLIENYSLAKENKGEFEKVFHFVSKNDDLPVNFTLDAYPKETNEDIAGNKKVDSYSFEIKVLPKKDVFIYNDSNKKGKDKNQIYYSFEKNGKAYLGVLGFNFNSENGEISNFRFVTKPINKKLSSDELKKYADSVYYSGWFDGGYTIKNSTVISDVNNMDVGTDEDYYKKLSEKYKDKKALNMALKLLGAKIAGSEYYRSFFDIGGLDKEGANTGDILGVVITEDGVNRSGLYDALNDFYKDIRKLGLSPYEVDKLAKDIASYPEVDMQNKKEFLNFLADVNDSGKLGDEKKAIYDETLVLKMKNLSMSDIMKKIDEIISFSGVDPKAVKDIHIKKALFWRGLENWKPSSAIINKYFSGKEPLSKLIKEDIDRKQKIEARFLERMLGKQEAKKFKDKLNQKFENMKSELEKLYGGKLDQSILNRLYNTIHYAGLSAFYVDHTQKKDDMGLSLSYKVDWDFIDNLSLGVVRTDNGKTLLGISVSKNFTKKIDENTTIGASVGDANIVYPFASLNVSHNFANSKLEDWTNSGKTIKGTLITTFPTLAGYVGVNFGKADALAQKEQVVTNFLKKIYRNLLEGKEIKLSEEDKKDVVKVNMLKAIKSFLKVMDFDNMSDKQKEIVLSTLIDSIKNNYVRLDALSNKGTRLAELGVMFTPLLPLIVAKFEQIDVNYKLSKKTPENVKSAISTLDKIEIASIKDIVNTLNSNPDFKDSIEEKDGILVMDLSKVKTAQIAFGDNVEVQLKGNKLLIGGKIDDFVFTKLQGVGEYSYLVAFGKNALLDNLKGGYSLQNAVYVKNGKIEKNFLSPSSKISRAEIVKNKNTVSEKFKNDFIDAKKKFEKTKLYKLLNEGMFGSIFESNIVKSVPSADPEIGKKGIVGEYEKLVDLTRSGKVEEAFDFFKNIMLKRLSGVKYTPLATYMIHVNKISQQKLDEIRADLGKINDIVTKKLVLETVFRKFFLDEYILDKQNYDKIKVDFYTALSKNNIRKEGENYILPREILAKIPEKIRKQWGLENGKIPVGEELILEGVAKKIGDKELAKLSHKWYFVRMSMKDFDTKDLAEKKAYNRTAGFLRSFRDELFGYHTILQGHLKISGEKDISRLEKEAKNFVDNNKLPKWLENYLPEIQEKVKLLYRVLLANISYISDKAFEKPTYKTVDAQNVIAFPYTYKLAVPLEHSHLPLYGFVNLVDKNGDGKFDKSDMEIIDTKEMREYVWKMLTDNFKSSFKKLTGLNDNQLHQLFVDKSLKINNKEISLDYNIGLAKWGDCFNTSVVVSDLKLNKTISLPINGLTGEIYLHNDASVDIKSYMFGYGHKEDNSNSNNSENSSNSNNSENSSNSNNSENSSNSNNSSGRDGLKVSGDDSVNTRPKQTEGTSPAEGTGEAPPSNNSKGFSGLKAGKDDSVDTR